MVMGSLLFPLFKEMFEEHDNPTEMAWRTVSIVPAFIAFATGLIIFVASDDAPTGNYAELIHHGSMHEIDAEESFRSGAYNLNAWILFLQYSACFGVELTMNNAAALYFQEEFGLSTESAAAIASIFGFMNLFARGLGGYWSDKASKSGLGMRGRLWVQATMLLIEGIMVILFAHAKELGTAIALLIVFSVFVQAAEGSTYGIVPFVDPVSTGSISGIVGAGGSAGAVLFGLGFREFKSYYQAYMFMGILIIASSSLSALIFIRGHSNFWCEKQPEDPSTATTHHHHHHRAAPLLPPHATVNADDSV